MGTRNLAPRAPKHHDVKCHPQPFALVRRRLKLFEIRVNDRDYREGDTITLHEYGHVDPPAFPGAGIEPRYTGEVEGPFTIGTLIPGGDWKLPDGLCVFSLLPVEPAGLPEGGLPGELVEGRSKNLITFYFRGLKRTLIVDDFDGMKNPMDTYSLGELCAAIRDRYNNFEKMYKAASTFQRAYAREQEKNRK